DHGVGQPDALAVALGQGPEQSPLHFLDPASVQAVIDTHGPLPAFDPLELGAELQVLADPHFWIQRYALGQVAHALPDFHAVVDRVEAGNAGNTAAGREIRGEYAHDGRLAGAVVTEQADDLVFLDVKTDVVDGADRAKEFGQVLDVNHGLPACPILG